jgi:hypothetical protein
VTHSPYARAPDLSVTLSRTAGQYLTIYFQQHTEAKDVITSKGKFILQRIKAYIPIEVVRYFSNSIFEILDDYAPKS